MQEIQWLPKAIELYKQGKSFMYIGKELGVNRKKISKVLNENGYKTQYSFETLNGVVREKKTWRKYNFNENYFETIDTEDKAYWLGFLYADGYVNSQKSSFELRVQENDYSHLKKFVQCINGNMPIRKTIKNVGNKQYIGWSVQVNSEKFKSDLIKLGCVENKSLILQFPTEKQISNNLIYHFIRGYVDGDGSYILRTNTYKGKKKTTISHSISVEIAGTQEFCEGYIKALGLHKNKIHLLRKTTTVNSRRVLYGGPYALQIIHKLYDNATIYLERKYQKIQQMIAVLGQDSQKT